MGRKPCCEKVGLNKGPWTIDEDHRLVKFIINNGILSWPLVPKMAGLMRCGKSCRLRWINYLRPDLKRGGFTEKEDNQIIKLHSRLGNRWSKIASHFPGRTDNEIKNHWNTKIRKKMKLLGLDHVTHTKIDDHNDKDMKIIPHPSSSKQPEGNLGNGKKDDQEMMDIMSFDTHAMEKMSKTESGEIVKEEQGMGVTVDDNNNASIEFVNNYEMINWHLDLKSWANNQGFNFSSAGSYSNTNSNNCVCVDDSKSNSNNNVSLGSESCFLQEDNTFQTWIDSMDPIPSWDSFDHFEQHLL